MNWLLASVGIVILGAIIAWLLLGPVSTRLAKPYISSTTSSSDDLESITKIRGTILQAAQGVVVVGGVLFTAGTLLYTARSVDLTRDTLNATRDGQVTDRYAKAVEELGSSSTDVRIGGIFALQRVGEDSTHDELTVMRVLQSFILDHGQQGSTPDDVRAALSALLESRLPNIDVHLEGAQLDGANIGTLGNFNPSSDKWRDLSYMHLNNAHLDGADLSSTTMGGVNLDGAHLAKATLVNAQLIDVSAVGADLHGANLLEATDTFGGDGHVDSVNFARANLSNAELEFCRLKQADLEGANLQGADLTRADLRYTNLSTTQLQRAILRDADLRGAVGLDPRYLTGAILHGAHMPDGSIPP